MQKREKGIESIIYSGTRHGQERRGEERKGEVEPPKAGGEGRRKKGIERDKLVTESGLFLLFSYLSILRGDGRG